MRQTPPLTPRRWRGVSACAPYGRTSRELARYRTPPARYALNALLRGPYSSQRRPPVLSDTVILPTRTASHSPSRRQTGRTVPKPVHYRQDKPGAR